MTETRTEDKRREILDASARVIAAKGLCDARIADVADLIGVSPALIIYYFDTKDALLVATLAHQEKAFRTALRALVGAEEAQRDKLRALITYSCPSGSATATTDSHWRLWFDLWSRSRLDPELAAERARFDSRLRKDISTLVDDGIRLREFRAIDSERFALELSSLIDGLAIQVLLDDPVVTCDVMLDTVLTFAERNLLD